MASATQRLSRYARWADAAQSAGDVAACEKYDRLMEKALGDVTTLTEAPRPPEHPPEPVPRYTAAQCASWTDEDFQRELSTCWDRGDHRSADALMHIMDEQSAGDMAQPEAVQSHARAMMEYRTDALQAEPCRMTDPSWRPRHRLTPEQRVRRDYEAYLDMQWLRAEEDCRGVLVTPEARAKGISARSLFQGSTARAARYASEELQSWWGKHGRLNYAAFRYQALGRESDRAAAERARLSSFDDVPAWSDGGAA